MKTSACEESPKVFENAISMQQNNLFTDVKTRETIDNTNVIVDSNNCFEIPLTDLVHSASEFSKLHSNSENSNDSQEIHLQNKSTSTMLSSDMQEKKIIQEDSHPKSFECGVDNNSSFNADLTVVNGLSPIDTNIEKPQIENLQGTNDFISNHLQKHANSCIQEKKHEETNCLDYNTCNVTDLKPCGDTISNPLLHSKVPHNDQVVASTDDCNEIIKSEKVQVSINSPSQTFDSRSFSPIPSTSRDNFIIDINDSRFNKVSGISKSPIHTTVDLISDNIEDLTSVGGKVKPISNVIECSSESDSEDVIVTTDVQKSNDVIDLILEDSIDKNDSDCEIIDVDTLLAENNAVLEKLSNDVQLSTKCPDVVRQNLTQAVSSDEEVIWSEQKEEKKPSKFPSQLDHVGFEKMAQIVKEFFVEHFPVSFQKKRGEPSEIDRIIPGPAENSKRRRGKERHGKHKMKKVYDIIDLVNASNFIAQQEASEVVVIDSDTSFNTGNISNIENTSIIKDVTSKDQSTVSTTNINIVNNQDSRNLIEENVPKYEVPPPKNYGDCPVCLENFSNTEAVSTFCGHVFCLPCMVTVKATSKKCPTCRKPLKGKGFHQIFL